MCVAAHDRNTMTVSITAWETTAIGDAKTRVWASHGRDRGVGSVALWPLREHINRELIRLATLQLAGTATR